MKRIFTTVLVLTCFAVYAQDAPKQAIIKIKTTIVSPESDENNAPPPPPPPGEGGERRMVFMGGGDMEFNSTTYIKGDMNKTIVKSDFFNMTTIRDNVNKKTTTLNEMMGKKTATVATDEEQEQMRKQMDSMMQSNPQFGGRDRNNTPPTYDVVYVDGSQKIAGYDCKKALIIATRGLRKDSTEVWYCPDLKFEGVNIFGGNQRGGVMGGGMMMNLGLGGLDKINGTPMKYERNMNRGRKLTVEVQKVDIKTEIKDSEFEIPKGYEIQSAKDAQRGFGGFQMRVGG